MVMRSDNNRKENIFLEVELLNQACLDLVAQIEELKKENARLRKKAKEGSGSGGKLEI